MKKSEWSEAEKACVSIYKHNQRETLASHGMPKAYGIGRKLLAELEPDVKPVFPNTKCFILQSTGGISDGYSQKCQATQGNTFATKLLVEKESIRRAAQTRVREKINLANKGDNGFKHGYGNYVIRYNYDRGELDAFDLRILQSQFDWEYIQSRESAYKLLKDKEFVADWKLMKGIKE